MRLERRRTLTNPGAQNAENCSQTMRLAAHELEQNRGRPLTTAEAQPLAEVCCTKCHAFRPPSCRTNANRHSTRFQATANHFGG